MTKYTIQLDPDTEDLIVLTQLRVGMECCHDRHFGDEDDKMLEHLKAVYEYYGGNKEYRRLGGD